MYYENFDTLCKQKQVRPSDVSRATGIATATLTEWKKGTYTPKPEKLEKIASFFNVSLEYLMTGKDTEKASDSGKKYYFSDEAAETAQAIFEDRDLHALFDAARDATPRDLQMAAEMLRRFKATNPDG